MRLAFSARTFSPLIACIANLTTFGSCCITTRKSHTIPAAICISHRGVPLFLKCCLPVSRSGLASDGPASSNNHSLFQAMKFAALMQKGFHQDATVITAEKVLEMATIDGARAVGLEAEIGSIEAG